MGTCMIMMSFTSIRRVLSALFGVSGKNIPDYFKRKLASGSRKGNVNEVAINMVLIITLSYNVYYCIILLIQQCTNAS